METCKKFQDLIFSDFIDDEMEQKSRKELEAHVSSCSKCRELFEDVKKNLVVPFAQTDRKTPPNSIWNSIKEKLEGQNIQEEKAGFWGRFVPPAFVPRLAAALGGLLIVLCAGLWMFQNNQAQQAKDKEEESYLAYLLTPTGGPVDSSSEDLGTSIERYFL